MFPLMGMLERECVCFMKIEHKDYKDKRVFV